MIHPRLLQRMSIAAAIILEMAVTVVLGVVAGAWLDNKLGSSPALLVVLAIGGLIVGMTRLVHSLNRLKPPDERDPPEAGS